MAPHQRYENAEKWARVKTKKDHTKNEDIQREANIEPTNKLRQTEMIEMTWPQIDQQDAKYAGKEKKEAQEKMDRQTSESR